MILFECKDESDLGLAFKNHSLATVLGLGSSGGAQRDLLGAGSILFLGPGMVL